MRIPLWSESNPSIKEILLPTSVVDWYDLSDGEKKRMWRYLESFLFNPEPNKRKASFNAISCNYEFHGKDIYENDHLVKTVAISIDVLNDLYKKKSFARNYLEDKTYNSACEDFYNIFLNQPKDIVFELVTIFSRIMSSRDKERTWKKQGESEKDFEKRCEEERWRRFDIFSSNINEVFEQFGINYKLTRIGLTPADEPVIIEKIYEPALKKLSNKKWAEVNRDLKDAFKDLGDKKDGSGAITHTLSALQGFLQILVNGKTGKGDTSKLIEEAFTKKLIPEDDFSKNIIKGMNSFWAKERQAKGDPHPKKVYATKNEAKLVISLVMVFIDHVL